MLSEHKYTAFGIIVIVLILFFSALFFGYLSLRRSLPTEKGSIQVDGLRVSVQVYRDPWGVPHIIAQNDHDLFFASGFVTAQDRLWQMDMFRRAANGQLAQAYGEDLLKADVLARTIGFSRIAKNILEHASDESRQILQAYADGINALIERKSHHLPIEFSLARYLPEPWEIEDSIAFLRLLGWHLTMAWYIDLVYGQLLEKFGEEKTLELLPTYPQNARKILTTLSIKPSVQEFRYSNFLLKDFLKLPHSGVGSNAWVISGKHSTTGKPLLANDLYFAFSAPCLFYEIHLKSPGLEVAGVGLAGFPGVVIGHNRAIAWGLTNSVIDDADFYVEELDPQESSRYIFRGKSEKFVETEEIIYVKGSEPVKIIVRETRHGPVISNFNKNSKNSNTTVTLRWMGHDISQELDGFINLMRAQNWDDFTKGLEHFGVPTQNFVYADTAGNIGYHLAGAIPIRNSNSGFFPVKGVDGKHEWIGRIPFQNLPKSFNPASRMIISANNDIFGRQYPYYLSSYWNPTFRTQRISELLTRREIFSIKDFMEIQLDQKSLMAPELLPYLLDVFQAMPLQRGEPLEEAYQLIKNWDFIENTESIAAAIFHSFYVSFIRNIFLDEMGQELFTQFIQVPNVPIRVVSHLLNKGESSWFDDVRTTDVIEDMNTIILQSMRDGLDSLTSSIGKFTSWQWGKIHSLTFSHPYSTISSVGMFFNIGPYSVGGSGVTVNNSCYLFNKPFHPFEGTNTRQIVGLADIKNTLSVITTGQSGQFLSKHYKDQTPLWLNGDYRIITMDSFKFEDDGWKLLTLSPGASR